MRYRLLKRGSSSSLCTLSDRINNSAHSRPPGCEGIFTLAIKMKKRLPAALVTLFYSMQIVATTYTANGVAVAGEHETPWKHPLTESKFYKTAILNPDSRTVTLAGIDVFMRDGGVGKRPLAVTVECFSGQSTPALALDSEQYSVSARLLNITARAQHPCNSYQVTVAAAVETTGKASSATLTDDELSTIAVSVHTSDVSLKDRRLSNRAVFTFNGVHGNWTEAKSFVPAAQDTKRVYATLTEQSQRIIGGVIALPDALHGEPARNESASVSEPLDQVSPVDGYLKIDEIEPDTRGAYSIDLPLLLRPSRGAGPSFAVTYSSVGAPGVLGRGWDLSFSAVEVRGPSPIYHPAYETEDYLLDGMDLIALDANGKEIPPLFKGGPILPRIKGERVFRLRNNSAGLIVRRRGSAPNEYFWEVWDPKSHVTRLYGAKFELSKPAPAIEADGNGLLRGTVAFRDGSAREVIAQWALTQEYDSQPARSGSRYRYTNTAAAAGKTRGDCSHSSWTGNCRAALKLDSAHYNRAFGLSPDPVLDRGETTVRFKWREREPQRFNSDGRLGFFRAQEFWLEKIDVLYKPQEDNLWLASANGDPGLPNGEVLYSSHTFELNEPAPEAGEEPVQACMNYDRVLQTYSVRANALVDGKVDRAEKIAANTEMQTFTFKYAGEDCTTKWDKTQEFVAGKAGLGELGSDAPGGKLEFPADLVKSLGLDLLQSQSLLGTARTEETGASLYVGVGPADNLTAKPVSGGIKGGTTFTKSEGNSTLVDITGDGIDDIVFRNSGKLRYCAGERNDKYQLSYEHCGRIEGPSEFAVSSTSTSSAAAEGFAPGSIFGAVGYNSSKNNTYVYFTHQDGDGLVDLAAYGQIFYGQGEQVLGEDGKIDRVVRFLPKSALTPPIPGDVAKTKLQAHLPAQLRTTIREVEARLAEVSKRLQSLEYSQTTFAWESPLNGAVSISGLFEIGESARRGESRGAFPETFNPSAFEEMPGRVKPYSDYVDQKNDCMKWPDEEVCHQKYSDPFSPGYERKQSELFEFIKTPPVRLLVSRHDRRLPEPTPCTGNEVFGANGRLDVGTLKFNSACQPENALLDQTGARSKIEGSKLISVRTGDVIYITYSVHPHLSKWIRPSVKIAFEAVEDDPIFSFLKYGKLTSGGRKEGIETALGCRWKDPKNISLPNLCLLADLSRYEFDLRTGALTSAPGETVFLAAGTGRMLQGRFAFPADLIRDYHVYFDLLGIETTESEADRVTPPSIPLMRLDAAADCTADQCLVDLSTMCSQASNAAACADFAKDDAPAYVLASRLTVEHKLSTPIAAREISSRLSDMRWLEAPAVVSKFKEKESDTPILKPSEDKRTLVYLPVQMGDSDIEYARVEEGEFDNPDVDLNEDSDVQPERIDFSKIQQYELLNVEMARKRQTIDLCRFSKEIFDFLESRSSSSGPPYADDYSGYWSTKIDAVEQRCAEAENWLLVRAFTNDHRPDHSAPDSLRLQAILQNLQYDEQVSSAEILLERVLNTLALGEELLTDGPRLTRRGYRLPAKVNPLDCEVIASAAEPLERPISSNQGTCAYRVLANFAMQDFEDVMAGDDAKNLRRVLAEFAGSNTSAFELELTATANGVPVKFRELSGQVTANEECTPKLQNVKTCLGNYGTREPIKGYYFPGRQDDVFQRITVNKRTGRAVAFSNSIMGRNKLAVCKRDHPNYLDGRAMERKQDCDLSSIGPGNKYLDSSSFSIVYQITEGNEFIGRNRVFEFEGRPLDIVEFHFRVTPKAREIQILNAEKVVAGAFSIFHNKAGRQMIRRSPAEILPYPADLPPNKRRKLACPAFEISIPPLPPSDTSFRLSSDCRPWTNLGWTELLLGAQYRTYSDAQKTGLEFQFSIKRRREILRLFPEIEVDADKYFPRDNLPEKLPILDKLPLQELAIAGVIKSNTREILEDLNYTPSVIQQVEEPKRYLAYASYKPNVAKVGGYWAFFAGVNKSAREDADADKLPDGLLTLPAKFRNVRYDREILKNVARDNTGAYKSALNSCGSVTNAQFESCEQNLGKEGQKTLELRDLDLVALVHHFVGPTVVGSASPALAPTGVCTAEAPTTTASCWRGVEDTIALESGIGSNVPDTQSPFHSVSALMGFERVPITQFLFEFDTYQNLLCMDLDWSPDKCGRAENGPTKGAIPPRPAAPREDRVVEIFAPVQSSQSKTVSFNGGAAFLNKSSSTTQRETKISYQDVNGDGYPEVISGGTAELTSPVGLSRRDWWHYFRVQPGPVSLGSELYTDELAMRAASESDGEGFGLSPATAALFKPHGTKSDKSGSPDPNVDPSFEFGSEDGHDNEFTELRDFNGDGLADTVTGKTVADELTLLFNTGNNAKTMGTGAFTVGGAPATGIHFNTNHSAGFGVRLGYSYEAGSFASGMGLAHRDSGSQGALLDFTGDGRPDIVVPTGDSLTVYPNLGNGFGKGRVHKIDGWQDRATSFSETTLVDAGAQYTFGFPIPFTILKVVFNPGTKFSRNQTRELVQIRDMNGDGAPDIASVSGAFKAEGSKITPVADGKLTTKVYYNPDAKYYLLTAVKNPTGSEFLLRHDLYGNEGPQQGNPIWALTEVAKHDGFNPGNATNFAADGQDVLLNRYHYEDGYYNRAEGQFYGFAKRTTTVYGCDDDVSATGCLAEINKTDEISNESLKRAGYRKLREIRNRYSNRDFLSQGVMLSEVVLGAKSGADEVASPASKLFPLSKTVLGYSIDDLQSLSTIGAGECAKPLKGSRTGDSWQEGGFSVAESSLSERWDGSADYGGNGHILGEAGICKSGLAGCDAILRRNMCVDGFVREQRSFWAQLSGSVRQRFIALQTAAPSENSAKLDCIFSDDPECADQDKTPKLNSAIAMDHDQWGQIVAVNNVGEASMDWKPVETSSTHAAINYARRQGPAGASRFGYPMLGLAEAIQIYDRPWPAAQKQSPIRVREAVYPRDNEPNGLRGVPSDICLYPDRTAGFKFDPGICERFRDNMRRALGSGFASMQSALKGAYESDQSGLPAGSVEFNSIIHHQLIAYDHFGNLTHAISPLSKNKDWIERRFSYETDPFRLTATRSELTRCVQEAPGVGIDSKDLPELSQGNERCTYGLERLPALVTNKPVTHFSTSRIDTHSGKVAEVTDINTNALLYDFDRWGRLRLIARQWGNAPKENKTFQEQLKTAVAKSDLEPAAPDEVAEITNWRILTLADYSCMKASHGVAAENCRSKPEPAGVLRSNVRRFEVADSYSGLLNRGNTTRETALFADGLGRSIQSVREAEVCIEALPSLFDSDLGVLPVTFAKNVPSKAGLLERCKKVADTVVTPSTAIDALGRDLISFEPYTPDKAPSARTGSERRFEELLAPGAKPEPLARSTFDGAGRPLLIASRLANPESTRPGTVRGTRQFRYQIVQKDNGPARFESLTLSPRCSASAAWSDARGLTVSVFEGQARRFIISSNPLAGGPPDTSAAYMRNKGRTAEMCVLIGNIAADWPTAIEHPDRIAVGVPARTDYTYDSLQQLNLIDYPLDNTARARISVRYDLLGRRVQMQEPNSGCTRYSYDGMNLLVSESSFRHDPGNEPTCGATFQSRNEKSYTYSGGRLVEMAYHSLEEQGDDPDKGDTVRFFYDRYPYANDNGQLIESPKFVANDLANQHLIDVTGRYCDNCIGQVALVSDRSGARSFAYNELGLPRREVRSIVGPLANVAQSSGRAETYLPEVAAYELENSYSSFGDLVQEEFSESVPANPADACVKAGVDTCIARFSIGWRYSPDGALAALLFNGKSIINSAQDALGRPAVGWTSNGSTTAYSYDVDDLRLNKMSTLTSADQRVQAVGYQYDGNGNIADYKNRARSSDDYGSAFSFEYDAVNRLNAFRSAVQATIGSKSHTMTADGTYAYDAGHRFMSRTLNIQEEPILNFRRSWGYANNNDPARGPVHAPAAVTFVIGESGRTTNLGYDEIGRMTRVGTGVANSKSASAVVSNRNMTWDAEGRLIHVRGLPDAALPGNDDWLREHFVYDFGGNRTLKMHQPNVFGEEVASSAAGTTAIKVDNSTLGQKPRTIESAIIYMTPHYARPYDARGSVQLSVGTLPVASMAAPADESEDPTVTYLYADLPVGSMTASVTAFGEANDGSATVVARREYDPYGLPLTSDGLADTGREGVPPISVFHGKELDRVTGFSSFGARYYSRDVGIWLSPDPMVPNYLAGAPDGGIFVASNINAYAYSSNNPSIVTDPTGQFGEFAAAGCAITIEVGCGPGALVGLAVDAAILAGVTATAACAASQDCRNHLQASIRTISKLPPFTTVLNEKTKARDTVPVKDLVPTHSEETAGSRSDLEKLSDDELLEAVRNPRDKNPIQIKTDTGKVHEGNRRVWELKKRSQDPGSSIKPDTRIPVERYTPENMFPDLKTRTRSSASPD
ncbi:hypothetical protein CN116_03785 [Sinorhizobium meliloti]|nr:hypothetical protein CN125_14080 [Sinorhizobium meliloti]RVM49994.1 hypothetical protein CN121_07450 [Sinorhizobium meliloti]RVM66777.1 hypothetical protein CN124_13365 [Sinorhizobium meliloti]RVM72992.1 hypothetical protein CN123_02925 [Sinorhizobium meliloti]RVM87614.1 hypothetical protein CN117_05145 [Sinorhizobium meliloti]